MEGLPVKLWGLDPLYWTHVKLFVRDVLQLERYPGFKGVFAINNHPIIKAQIMGYVVKVQRRPKLTVYAVDDGSGTIPCCRWLNQDEIGADNSHEGPSLGALVTVLGEITTFREQRQITLTTIYIEEDPNAEILFWLEVLKNKEIYNKPFEVPVQLTKKVKIVKKPSTQDPLDTEFDKLEQELKEDISKFLESKNLQSFSIDDLCDVDNVKEKAALLSKKYKDRLICKKTLVSNEQESLSMAKVIRPILTLLEKDGRIYRKESADGYNFEVISKKHLGSQILQMMQDITDKEGESSFGTSSTRILTSLKSLKKYKYVCRDKFREALQTLLECGDIYETKDYHYRRI